MSVQVCVEQHEGASQCVGSICCHTESRGQGQGRQRSQKVQSCKFHHCAFKGKLGLDWKPVHIVAVCRYFGGNLQQLSRDFKHIWINDKQSFSCHSFVCCLDFQQQFWNSNSNLRRLASVGCTGRSVWKSARGPSLSPASLPWVEKPLRSSCCTQINPRGRQQVKMSASKAT